MKTEWNGDWEGSGPQEKDVDAIDKASVQCFQCNGFGHYARECPHSKGDQKGSFKEKGFGKGSKGFGKGDQFKGKGKGFYGNQKGYKGNGTFFG